MQPHRKSSSMYVSVLLFYLVCAAVLNPHIATVLGGTAGFTGNMLLLAFAAQLNLFWLFGGYHLMLGVFAVLDRLQRPGPLEPIRSGPRVALLYVTMNDFQQRAALSCLRQTYALCHLFILDDSVDAASQAEVDAFAQQHPETVTVVRRSNRRGYKAGSINAALRDHVRGFPYFIVVDADSVLPEHFTGGLMPYFGLGEDIGWVQASHAPNPVQKTQFARDLGLGILPLWEVYYGPRNRFGNVIFLGHGGMIRYDVWHEVGGFPEIVSEDLAFSTRAAQIGYRGYFAHHVVSYEDFPEGYRQLRRQQAKYVKGVCEYLHRECLPYLRSRRVRWFEKADVLFSCWSLFMPSLVLTFMVTFCVLIPLKFGVWRPATFQAMGHEVLTIPVLLLTDGFNQLWTWQYFAVTLACTLAPLLGCFSVIARRPRAGTKMFLVSAVPYLSLLVMATAAIVSYALSQKAVFLVTGDRWGIDPQSSPEGFSRTSRLVERIGAEDAITRILEFGLGFALTVVCIMTLNVSLMAFALALLLGPVLLKIGWEARLLRPFLFLPFVLISFGLLLGGVNAATLQGASMSVFFFHF